MRSYLRPLLLLVVVFAATGCMRERPLHPAPSAAPIQTGKSTYVVEQDGPFLRTEIPFEYLNRTGGPVYVPKCQETYPPVLEKQVEGEWIVAYAPVVLLCWEPPVVIGAGERYRSTFRMLAARPGTRAEPTFRVEQIPGTYRLVWSLYRTVLPMQMADPLPREQRISNEFALTEAGASR